MNNYAERKRNIRLGGLVAVTAVLLIAFTGCDRAESLSAVPLEVSAGIAGGYTRVAGDKDATNYEKKNNFEAGDQITIRKSTAAESSAVAYKKGTNGWLPVDNSQQILTSGNEAFFASYPPEYTSILSDQSTYTNFWKSNRLTSTATATSNHVSFTFSPAAAKITVIVIYAVNNTAEGAKVEGQNVCTESGKTGVLQLLCTSNEVRRHTYTGILSTAASSYTISVSTTVGGTSETKSYVEKGGGLTLQAGYEYQYTFTATTELILSSVIVKEFQSTTEENVGPAT